MNWESVGIFLGIGAVIGYIGYTICLFNWVRFLVFGYLVYIIYQMFLVKAYWEMIIYFSASLIFVIRFYRLNPYFFSRLFSPFVLFFRGGVKAGAFALSIADGTLDRTKTTKKRACRI